MEDNVVRYVCIQKSLAQWHLGYIDHSYHTDLFHTDGDLIAL